MEQREHVRDRVAQRRVRAGAAEPAREHAGRAAVARSPTWARARARTRCPCSWRTSTPDDRPDAASNRGQLHRHAAGRTPLDEPHGSVLPGPRPGIALGRPTTANFGLYNNTTLFNNAKSIGYATNFWVMNPLVERAWTSRRTIRAASGTTSSSASCAAGCRPVSRCRAATRTHASTRRASRTSTCRCSTCRNTGVPHAFKMLWTYDIPYGRGKRYGANINPWVDYLVGGWTFSGAGRVQIQSFVLRNAVVVGMTLDEARGRSEGGAVRAGSGDAARPRSGTSRRTSWTTRAGRTARTKPADVLRAGHRADRTILRAGGRSDLQLPDCRATAGPPSSGSAAVGSASSTSAWPKSVPVKKAVRSERRGVQCPDGEELPRVAQPEHQLGRLRRRTPAFGRICSTQSGARTAQLVFRVSW